MNAPVKISPYLTGNFAPLHEENDFEDLPVTGEMPKGLNGTFYRNGPNPQFEPRDAFYHWFAGDGMIHAFTVADGKASYKNRYVRTPKWELENKAGKAMFGTFGNPMTTALRAQGKDSGVANTNIVWHAGRLLALEEGHEPFELDPKTLEPRGYREYAGKAKRFTAHPKMDPETGEMVFFGYMAGGMPFTNKLGYGVADKTGKTTRLDIFEAPYMAMIHDFMVTQNYVAFPVLPLTGSLQRTMMGKPPFAWEPEKGSHVGVMRRDAGVDTIKWFTTDPCYVFHPMNMWDDGDKMFADVMQYETAPLFPNADGSPGIASSARLMRWEFDLSGKTNTIKRTQIDDTPGEFPRFDERRAGLPYRYGYFAASTKDDGKVVFDSIGFIDHKTGKKLLHTFAPGDVTGEPVFVPRSADAPEGDGWLVATVYRGTEDRNDFVVFDASDITKGPIATAALPRRVPFGFHGNWVNAR